MTLGAPKKIVLLREVFNWMGNHSGYDQVCNFVSKTEDFSFKSVHKPRNESQIPALKKILLSPNVIKNLRPNPFYDQKALSAEVEAIIKTIILRSDLLHINYVENNFALTSYPVLPKKTKIVGTIHQPPDWYEKNYCKKEILKKLDAIIILCAAYQDYFELLNPGKVYFIPHGIDTEFFSPDDQSSISPHEKRILFSGHWMRDIHSLSMTIREINNTIPEAHFDLLVPTHKRNTADFKEIGQFKNVHWHADLTDIELLDVYRKTTMLFIPMIDATANNAILEAMACGKPVISTRIGGIPEYTHDSFATLCPKEDVNEYVKAIIYLLTNEKETISRGICAREYALNHFCWEMIGSKTIDLYKQILQ